jgi:hypothetical protein
MICAAHPDADATSTCTRCSMPLCAACTDTIDDKAYCRPCADHLRERSARRYAVDIAPKSEDDGTFSPPAAVRPESLARGIAFALGAGAVGALVWYGLTLATGKRFSLLAFGVGFGVGLAALIGNQGRTDKRLGVAAAAIAVGSMFAGDWLMVSHLAKITAEGLGKTTAEMSFSLFDLWWATMDALSWLAYAAGAIEAFRQPALGKA